MPPAADLSSWFNNPDDADVLLHLSTADPAADTEEHARTFHAHALLLKAGSDYFHTQLTGDWQQQPSKRRKTSGCPTPSSTAAAPAAAAIRYELVEHVEEGELEAMEQLLRLMYGLAIPPDAPQEMLLQMLRLADRYQATVCAEFVLTHMAAQNELSITASFLKQVTSLPTALHGLPAFHAFLSRCISGFVSVFSAAPRPVVGTGLLNACKRFILWRFSDVPSVIQSDELRQQFCKLPHAAVLAWAESDQLRVHSENCVVYLLSAWVKAQGVSEDDASSDSSASDESVGPCAEELEQLAHQVRVLQLGPAYQFFVLPHLEWFKGCSGMAHFYFLLAYKGASSTGKPVFPSQAVGRDSGPEWQWDGPAAWVAGPRQLLPAAARSLKWDLGPEELQQLYGGRLDSLVLCTPHLYVNGLQAEFQLHVSKKEDEGPGQGEMLGTYFYVSHQMMSRHGVPWPDTASVSVRKLDFKVNAAAGVTAVFRRLVKTRSATQHKGWGYANVLERSAPTLQKLVAPLLVDGKLLLEMTVEGVDLSA